jgi:hypothetical protein
MTLQPVNPLTDPWFNKAAFAVPQTFTFGNASRSYTELRAPNSYNESFGVVRRIRVTEKMTATVRGEFFNALNRVVFGVPQSNISSSGYGRVSSQANTPRQGQVSLRLEF